MDRRTFAGIVATSVLGNLVAGAKSTERVWRVGFLTSGARPADGLPPPPLRDELRALGYAEGTGIAYEGRWSQGRNERLRELTAELLARNVDLIVALGGPAAE